MAKDIVDQQIAVPAPCGGVVDVLRREVGVAVAAKVGRDDLITRLRQRRDVAAPDPLGLWIAVKQQQRISADAFVDERERQAVAALTRSHFAAMDRERVGSGCGGLRGPQAQVVVHASECCTYRSNAFGSTIK